MAKMTTTTIIILTTYNTEGDMVSRCHGLNLSGSTMQILLQLANQPVASESERAGDQFQNAAVIPPVNLSFSFVSRVSRHLNDVIAIDRLTTYSNRLQTET